MSFYSYDRNFTNIIHDEVAIKEIYNLLGWKMYPMDMEKLNKLDLENGIDYVLTDSRGRKIFVQERFREYKYHHYTDVTLRYRRDHNKDIHNHESEFYKIKANYLVYGIINGSKQQAINHSKEINFVKFAVVDLDVLFKHLKKGDIVLDSKIGRPIIRNGKLFSPINENTDYSSNFVAFDVQMLDELFGDEDIILFQKGFY